MRRPPRFYIAHQSINHMANLLNQVGKYNKIPTELIPELPAKGTVAVFQFDTRFNIKDPVADSGKPRSNFCNDYTFPAFSSFRYNGDWVHIGMLNDIDKVTGEPLVNTVIRGILFCSPKKGVGFFRMIIGASPLMDSFYQYLMLASFVGENKISAENKNPDQQIDLTYVDYDKKAKEDMAKQDLKWKAIGIAANLGEDQLADMQFLLGLGKDLTPSQVLAGIRNEAESNPERFLARVEDQSGPIKARVAQAVALGIIFMDPEGKCLRWNDATKNEIMKVSNTAPEAYQEEYALYVKSNPDSKVDRALAGAIKGAAKKKATA